MTDYLNNRVGDINKNNVFHVNVEAVNVVNIQHGGRIQVGHGGGGVMLFDQYDCNRYVPYNAIQKISDWKFQINIKLSHHNFFFCKFVNLKYFTAKMFSEEIFYCKIKYC